MQLVNQCQREVLATVMCHPVYIFLMQPDPRDGLAADAVRGGRGRLGRPARGHRRRQPVAEPRGSAIAVQQTGKEGCDSG